MGEGRASGSAPHRVAGVAPRAQSSARHRRAAHAWGHQPRRYRPSDGPESLDRVEPRQRPPSVGDGHRARDRRRRGDRLAGRPAPGARRPGPLGRSRRRARLRPRLAARRHRRPLLHDPRRVLRGARGRHRRRGRARHRCGTRVRAHRGGRRRARPRARRGHGAARPDRPRERPRALPADPSRLGRARPRGGDGGAPRAARAPRQRRQRRRARRIDLRRRPRDAS